MNIDFSAVTSSPQYDKDKLKLSTSGKKRARQIWMIIAMIFIPLLWPVGIFLAIKGFKNSMTSSKLRIIALEKFASINGYIFTDNTGKLIYADGTSKKIESGSQLLSEVAKGMSDSMKMGPGNLNENSLAKLKPKAPISLPFKVTKISHAHELKGKIDGYPISYSMSSVYVGTEHNSSQFLYNLFTIELPVKLPRMFLNSKSNNLRGLDAGAVNFESYQDHKLEGDFPEYYSVWIEKDEQIDMYTILTPEVMDTLKRNDMFDVWLDSNQLTLITFADQARYFAGTPVAFESAIVLMSEIDKIARAYRSKSN
jgi:hypothetical protein